jgi:hypothetical protein
MARRLGKILYNSFLQQNFENVKVFTNNPILSSSLEDITHIFGTSQFIDSIRDIDRIKIIELHSIVSNNSACIVIAYPKVNICDLTQAFELDHTNNGLNKKNFKIRNKEVTRLNKRDFKIRNKEVKKLEKKEKWVTKNLQKRSNLNYR